MSRKLMLAVLAALVLAAPAGAGSTITLRLGDGFVVKRTHILCTVQLSKSLIPGQKVIYCYYATLKGAVPKTYSVALAVNGEVALAKIDSNGAPKTVMTRTPAAVDATRPKLYAVGVGSAIIVKGTAITCAVNRQTFGGKSAVTAACFKVSPSKKPRPNSYGIGITDGGAFLVHFDAKSKGAPVKIVQHGK